MTTGPRRHWSHSQLALGRMGHRVNSFTYQTWTRTQHPTERACTLHPKGPQFNHLHHHPPHGQFILSPSLSLTLKVNHSHQLKSLRICGGYFETFMRFTSIILSFLFNFRNSLCPDENDLTNWDCQPKPYFAVFVSERFSVLRSVLREAICTCNISVMLVLLLHHYNLKHQRVSIVIVGVVPPQTAQKAQTW